MANVLFVVEHFRGRPKQATLNALTCARRIAKDLGADVSLLVIGDSVKPVVDALKPYGAGTIYVAENQSLAGYTAEAWAQVVAETAHADEAVFVGMNSGSTGRDLMPRVAVKLNAGMVSDLVGFDGNYFVRRMWAGNVLASVQVTTPVTIATIQGTAFATAEPVGGESRVVRIEVPNFKTKTRFLELRETQSERPDPTEARVVVSGGRGIKSKENFRLIEELADLFGGAVGASRAAVDAGWISNDFQVGQTGKTVAPDLYIAVGISGAIQHIAGMKDSKIIVAINKDEEAPIFQTADYGLVADLFVAVPELIEALKHKIG